MNGKKMREDLIYAGILVVVAVLICNMSKNSILSSGVPLTDSSVFQYIGYCMWRYGELPYLDFFDHKGPLIYFINMLGTFMSLRYGVFILEIFFMIIVLFFSWKTLTLLTDRFSAMLADVVCYLFLYDFFECGNLVEEYSMAFMAVSLYFFTDYYKNGKTTYAKIAMTGVCFAAVLLLRPNMIGIWIAFCCAIMLQQIRKKEYFYILGMSVSFGAGAAIVLLPSLWYLLKNDMLKAFWDCYIVFNFAYSGSGEGTFLYSLLRYLRTEFCVITIVLWGVSVFFEKKAGWIKGYFVVCTIAMGISMLLCCLPGNPVPHYLMTVFPIAAVWYAFGTAGILKYKKKIGIWAVLFVIGVQLWKLKDAYMKYQNDADLSVYQTAEVIQRYSGEEDKITVYGNACKYYLVSARKSVSRYIYQYPVGDIRPAIMNQYFDDLKSDEAAMIVIDSTFDMAEENNQKMDHLLSEGYELLYKDDQASVWINQDSGV